MTLVTIIIVNFNTYPYLTPCLDSINKEGLASDKLEVIVVDNASSDNSVVKLKRKYPKVRLIGNKENAGFSKANNQAVKKAKGDFILFLNPDTIISKGAINKVLDFILNHKDAGIATCRVELPTGEIDDACHRGFPTPWNAFCQFTGLSGLFPKSIFLNGYHLGYRDLDIVHEIDSCAGAFMLVRKKDGDKIGWFDEEYFWYGEDLDFCYRMRKANRKIYYIPAVKIIHFKGVSSGIKAHSQRNSPADRKTRILATKARFDVMEIFYKKHYQRKYPLWITKLVLLGIKIKKHFSLLRYL